MDIKEYTEFLVKSLVNDAEMIKVESFDGEDGKKVLEIMVPDEQMKYVLGKGGRNAQALRTLVNAFAYANNLKYVKINIESF